MKHWHTLLIAFVILFFMEMAACTDDPSANTIADFFNAPNPFSPSNQEDTTFSIQYTNSDQTSKVKVELTVLTMQYDVVRFIYREFALEDATASSETIQIGWDGKNDRGKQVLPGVYLTTVLVEALERSDTVGGSVNTSETTLVVN